MKVLTFLLLSFLSYSHPLMQKVESPSTTIKFITKTKSPLLNYGPDSLISHAVSEKGSEIWRVNYKIGKLYERKTHDSVNSKKVVLLLGGSNTFGQWIKDENTFGHQLFSKFSKSRDVINLSAMGSSLAQLFLVIKSKDFLEAMKGKEVDIVYNFYDFHILRDSCSVPEIFWNDGHYPNLEFVNGRFKYSGLCKEKLRVKLSLFARDTAQFLKLHRLRLGNINNHYSKFFSVEKIKNTFNILKQMKKDLGEVTKSIRVTVLANDYNFHFTGEQKDFITKYLNRENFLFKYFDSKQLVRNEDFFLFDKHMSPSGYKKLAATTYNLLK